MADNSQQAQSTALIDQYAKQYGVDPNIAQRMMAQESGGQWNAVSPKGAIGPMQLMPNTAKDLGVDPYDPKQNIEGGVRHLSNLLKQFGGNYRLAVAAYHAGAGAVKQAGGIPETNDGITTTQDYVDNIVGTPNPKYQKNPFADFSADEQQDIRKQLISLRNNSQLNEAQAAGVERALSYLQPVGTTPSTVPGLASMPGSPLRQQVQGQGTFGTNVTSAFAQGPSGLWEIANPNFMAGGLQEGLPDRVARQREAADKGILKTQKFWWSKQPVPTDEFADKRYDTPQMREYLGMTPAKPMIERAGDTVDTAVGSVTGTLQPVQLARDVGANYDTGLLKSGVVGEAVGQGVQAAVVMGSAGHAEAKTRPPEPKVEAKPEAPIVPAKETLPKAPAVKPEPVEAEPAQATPQTVSAAKPPAQAPMPSAATGYARAKELLDTNPEGGIPARAAMQREMGIDYNEAKGYFDKWQEEKAKAAPMPQPTKPPATDPYSKAKAVLDTYDPQGIQDMPALQAARLQHETGVDNATARQFVRRYANENASQSRPEAPQATAAKPPEPITVQDVQTPQIGSKTPEQYIEEAGLINKGKIDNHGQTVYMFEHPEHRGLTFSARPEDITSAEAMKAIANAKLLKNGVLAGPSSVDALKAKYGITSEPKTTINGSSESAGSFEAQSRLAGEKSRGEKWSRFNSFSGTETPILADVNAVDLQPNRGEILIKRDAEGNIIDRKPSVTLGGKSPKETLASAGGLQAENKISQPVKPEPPASKPPAKATEVPEPNVETDSTRIVSKFIDKLKQNQPLSESSRDALEKLTGVPLKDKDIPTQRHDLANWVQREYIERYRSEIQKRANTVAETAETAPKTEPQKPVKAAETTGAAGATPSVKRAADFDRSGEYDVAIGDKTYKMYRDAESKAWYEAGTGEHFSRSYLGPTKEEALKHLQERTAGGAAPVEAPKKTPRITGKPVTPEAQLAKDVKSLEDKIVKENPSLANSFGLVKSAAREATKDATGVQSNYKRGLQYIVDHPEDPNRLKKAIDIASRKGEAGFIGGMKPAYSDPMLEAMAKDHLDVTFAKWEAMTESELARNRVWEKVRAPQVERQVFLANDPVLTDRWEQLKTKAVGSEMSDPAQALTRVIGGEKFTPADLTKMTMRERLGEYKRSKEQMASHLEKAVKLFDKMSIKDSIKFIDDMEMGRKQSNPKMQVVADTLRFILDERRDAIKNLGTGKFDYFLENYFPHLWEMPNKAARTFQQMMNAKRPLQGGAAFLKPRDYQFWTDGLQAGLTPVTYNPVKMALLRVNEMDRYLMAHQILADLKDLKVVQWVKDSTPKRPDGYVPLEDRIFKPTRVIEGEGGHTRYGQYYAPYDAAKVIHNYLSPGLKGNAIYDTVRQYNNILNQSNLGISGFHGFEIMYDSFAGDLSLGLRQVFEGRVGAGAKSIGRSLSFVGSGLHNWYMGSKALAEYLSPGTHAELTQLVDDMSQAGGVAFQSPEYRNASGEALKRAAKQFQDAEGLNKLAPAAKAIIHSLGYGLEFASKPIMEKMVPQIKVGAFLKLAQDIHERLPNAPKEVITRELDSAWDSVDNRMGEVVYDNMFQNKVFKDLMQIGWRSYGWNLGTFREIGGGAYDMLAHGFTNIRKGITGKGDVKAASYRMYYPLGMVLGTAYFSAILQYAMTGKGPSQLADYFYPRTGLIDQNGKPERVYGKSYMQDTIAWFQHPLTTGSHKAAPYLQQAYELLWANQDYYGREIRHPDDPSWQQAWEIGKYLGRSAQPFTIQNTVQRMRSGAKLSSGLMSGFGIIPAPKWVGQTPFENFTFAHQDHSSNAKTDEQFQRTQEMSRLRNRLTQKMMTTKQAYDEGVRQGKISLEDFDKLLDEQANRTTPLERNFQRLPLPVALQGYIQFATPEERGQVQDMLFDKIDNKDPDTLNFKQQKAVQDMIKTALKLPVSHAKQ